MNGVPWHLGRTNSLTRIRCLEIACGATYMYAAWPRGRNKQPRIGEVGRIVIRIRSPHHYDLFCPEMETQHGAIGTGTNVANARQLSLPHALGTRPFTLERLLQQFDSRNLHGTLTLPSACCCSLATSTRWNVEVLG